MFFCKEIMLVLIPMLDIADIFQLTATCFAMRTKWCGSAKGSQEWAALFDMRQSVKNRFNIDFKGQNPFYFLVEAAKAARVAPKHGSAKARCFGGCGKSFTRYDLVNRSLCPYNSCLDCFIDRRSEMTIFSPGLRKPFFLESLRLKFLFDRKENVITEHKVEFFSPHFHVKSQFLTKKGQWEWKAKPISYADQLVSFFKLDVAFVPHSEIDISFVVMNEDGSYDYCSYPGYTSDVFERFIKPKIHFRSLFMSKIKVEEVIEDEIDYSTEYAQVSECRKAVTDWLQKVQKDIIMDENDFFLDFSKVVEQPEQKRLKIE